MPGELILVIDDSPTIRKVVATNLTRAGYEVETAGDGQEGLEVAIRISPQLILLDFVMPRMNGFQFCRAIREVDHLVGVPVVLMSAKGDKIGAKFIQQMGAVDSITKPFSPEALLAVSGHVLAKHRDGLGDKTAKVDLADLLDAEESALAGLGAKASALASLEPEEPFTSSDVTRPRWDPMSLAENQQAREVAEQIAARVADILTSALPDLAPRGDEIEEVLARRMTPKALAIISQTIAQLEPSAGQAAFAGDVATVPLAEVLQMLQLQKQTGCFEVRRDRFRVMVYFKDGRIDLAQAREGQAEFLLGRYMIEDEVIGRTELELMVRDNPDKDQVLIGQMLVTRGYLSQDDLSRLLERQSCELMYEMLRWRRGRYAFRPNVLSPEAELAGLALSAESVLMEGFRRVDEWRLIEQQIEDFDVVFRRDEGAVLDFGRERLTNEEQAILDTVDGRRSVRAIVELTQMGSFLVSKLLYRLLSVKLICKRRG